MYQPDYLLGIHDFKGRSDDEIDIARGDYIEIIEDDSAFNDSWYIGRNLTTNATGLFPKVFTTAVARLPQEIKNKVDEMDRNAGISDQIPGNYNQSYLPRPNININTQPGYESPTFNNIGEGLTDNNIADYSVAVSENSGISDIAAQNDLDAAISEMTQPIGVRDTRLSSSASPPVGGYPSSPSFNQSREEWTIDPHSVNEWLPNDVAAFFAGEGFHDEAPLFIEHRITGPILLEMDRETLKEIGITSFGLRFEIARIIKQFRVMLGLEVGENYTSPDTQTYCRDGKFQQVLEDNTRLTATSSFRNSPSISKLDYSTTTMTNSPQSLQFSSKFSPKLDDPSQFDFSPGSEDYRSSHDRNPSSTTSYSAPTSQRVKEKYDTDLKRSATEHDNKKTSSSTTTTTDQPSPNLAIVSYNSPKNSQRVSSTSSKMEDQKKHKHHSSVRSMLTSSSPRRSDSKDLSTPQSPASSSKESTIASEISSKEAAARNGKRSTNESTLKAIMRPGMIKQKTSAFQEGIKQVSALKAKDSADKAGWMHKRGGIGLGVWSKRYFTLHGTRLSYFSSFKETKERGLIDITGHRVVPVKDKELLISLSAAGMGAGRYCFKIIPPGPGYKKGVAFTAPKVHYFAVETEQEMRSWQAALTTATIERDESKPVVSTCQTPTMSLPKAQELMAERLAIKGNIGSLTNVE